MFNSNPIFLARPFSQLDKVESASIGPDGLPRYNVDIGLGATSRVKDGYCYDRHFSTGYCWGQFEGDNTRFVSNGDFNTSCALEENWLQGSQSMALTATTGPQGTLGNNMSLYRGGGMEAQPPCASRSFGLYSSCPNCTLSGASVLQCNTSNPTALWVNSKQTC